MPEPTNETSNSTPSTNENPKPIQKFMGDDNWMSIVNLYDTSNFIKDNYKLNNLKEDLNNNLIYTKEDIKDAKYKKFSRFGKIMDIHGRLNNTREYLFFVKPDLNIVKESSMELNDGLSSDSYFKDLVKNYPDVVRELQRSAGTGNSDPFSHLLSFGVNSNLDLPSMEANTLDTPSNIMGTSIEYLGDSIASDEKVSFSLEFVDTKELELYNYFKAFQMYQNRRRTGLVPINSKYIRERKLHYVLGIYKFLVDEDMETIIHYSYIWGAIPTSVPRDTFSSPEFQDGLTFSVSFKAGYVADLDPQILVDFNSLMGPLIQGKNRIDIYNKTKHSIIGTLPSAAYVYKTTVEYGRDGRSKYKLVWY